LKRWKSKFKIQNSNNQIPNSENRILRTKNTIWIINSKA